MVPYTLPGVLALIGCWWYLSRKKQGAVGGGSPAGPVLSAATGLKPSSSEGSNGLLESAASPAHRPSQLLEQRAEDGTVSHKVGAAPSSEDVPAERRRGGEEREREGPARLCSKDREDLAASPPPRADPSTAAAHLSEAERPEPEGEVAVLSEDETVVCALTPAKTEEEEEAPCEGRPLETPPQRLVSSTPSLAVASRVQEASEVALVCSEEEEEENLQLLASGLITEVISAATQEVLSCPLAASGRPNCSSTPLQEPVTAPQPRPPHSAAHNGCEEAEDSGMPNGCSPLHRGAHQTNSVPTDRRKLTAGEAAALADDSACSTCHSEDGVSGEELQISSNQARLVVAAAAPPPGEDDGVDDIKRLNGLSLRNGSGGNEVETDQSGGGTR